MANGSPHDACPTLIGTAIGMLIGMRLLGTVIGMVIGMLMIQTTPTMTHVTTSTML